MNPRDVLAVRSVASGRAARAVGAVVDASGRRPWTVLALAACVAALAWYFALDVLRHPRTDLRELLPTSSPGLQAFEHQLGRVGGGATLLVVVQAPARADAERFVDLLADGLEAAVARGDPTVAPHVAHVERGTKEVRAFARKQKWLYADLDDIRKAADTLDTQIAIRSGTASDLGDDGVPAPGAGSPSQSRPRPALGLEEVEARWNARIADFDGSPSGYFETQDGKSAGLRIVSRTTGTGDAAGDALLAAVRRLAQRASDAIGDPGLAFGFAGDIANAVAEKESVVGEAAWAGGIALALIVAGLVWFYRSAWAPVVVAVPSVIGVGLAYAFAHFRFGYVNTTGMFLGAIILGSGVNYPIVLLSRYREFAARGMPPAEARRVATQNALRAELVGACVASIAYGSLTTTEFRGFTQFGWIGLFGMLCVWLAMIPCVPALIVVMEGVEARVRGARPSPARSGGRGWSLAASLGNVAERAPRLALALIAAATAAAVTSAPRFLADPWEYNFEHLGSRGSKHGGAGEWSNKAEAVFGGKTNIAGAMILADSADQVREVKRRILASDAADPDGSLIAGVTTIQDLLPGSTDEQRAKIDALAAIRERLTPAVLGRLDEGERARVEALMPPASLRPIGPEDLPALLRRRFEERDGRLGTLMYVRFRSDVSLSDGHNLLRIAKDTDNVRLADGTVVQTASRSTIFAEMIRAMERDGPRAAAASLLGVAIVVVAATRDARGAASVLCALLAASLWLVGAAYALGEKLNYVNFVVLPITFGIGCEYPFNVYDRSRLLGGDVSAALDRVGGAVALCSYTTVVGYGSLLFADFQALQSFGRLAVSGEVACLVAALVLLPALLRLRRGSPIAAASRHGA